MPRKKIDASQVEDLALIGSTLAEMAMLLNCSEESLDRRFRKNIKRGMVRRMILIRSELLVRAVHGDATALKWFLQDSVSEQMRDFERRQKEFYASLSVEEMVDMVDKIDSLRLALQQQTDKETESPATPQQESDLGRLGANRPN